MAVLAPALVRARGELNTRWPNRDHTTCGWIGDLSHAATGSPESGGSDHNPNRRGVVDALDIDVDGIDCPTVVAKLIRHPSTHYVIWNRTIWSSDYGFAAHAYTGSNPHTDHIHASLRQSAAAENSTTPWGITGIDILPVSSPGQVEPSWARRLAAAMPVVRQSTGVRGSVRKLQVLLNLFNPPGGALQADGVFGPRTEAAVRQFQTTHGLTVDGIVGPKTWGELLGELPTTRRPAAGYDVRRIQTLVNVQGLPLPGGAELGVDGHFGPRTEAAVRQFQTTHGLTVDGIVGPVTWTALLSR